MSVINVENWTPEQVAEWVAGLDSNLSPYAKDLLFYSVNGKKLLNLMAGDLAKYGVNKIGDQLLLHDAIQLLRSELESDRMTLQSLASNLAVRCKNYRSELTRTITKTRKNYIPTESLSTASYLLDSAKIVIRWLTRYPFLGTIEYDDITKKLTKHCFELAMLSQRDSFADNAIEEVQYLCTKIIELCEYIITSKDSLIIQPAAVDVITLRKRHEQDLGLQFESSYFGIHQVTGVKLSSPAGQSGHLAERGDEILQINYQTVLGWPQQNLINLLHENSNEVILTIKRRPRHASNMLGHMYLRPKIPNRKKMISPIHEHSPLNESELEEAAVEEVKNLDKLKNAETRFWKLYPKPRNLIKRRATVSGASPIDTRPPVTFVDDDGERRQRPPLDKCKSAPEKILKKQDKFEVITTPGNRVTLPVMDNLETFPSSPEEVQELLKPKIENVLQVVAPAVVPAAAKAPTPPPRSIPEVAPNTPQPKPQIPPPPSAEAVKKSSSIPVHCGFLHLRQPQWKFGPRWTRFKAKIIENALVIGQESTLQVTQFGGDNVVTLASEVHSRPFAFKIENFIEKSVTYFAAESQRELEIWMNLLTSGKITGEKPTHHVYKRSISLGNSPRRAEVRISQTPQPDAKATPRRNSVLPKKQEVVSRSNSSRVRNEWLQSRSQSTSKLDEKSSKKNFSSVSNLSSKSNISSITIRSMKRTLQDYKSKQSSSGNPQQDTLTYSFEMDLDKPPAVPISASSSSAVKNCRKKSLGKECSAPTMGVSMLKSPLRNRTSSSSSDVFNVNSDSDSNSSLCPSCGRLNSISLADAATQTDSSVIVFKKEEIL